MPRLAKQLSLLLLLQLLLAGAFLAYDYRTEQRLGNPPPLLAFEPDRVDEIEISEGQDRVVLKRDGSGWHVDGETPWPASPSQVQDLLTGLTELTQGWPVSTTTQSHQRHEVSDDEPRRRIALKHAGSNLAEVLLGTSPGSGLTHLRVAGDSDVYAVAFAQYRAPIDPQAWLDRSLLKVSSPVQAVRLPGFRLSKGKEGWVAPEKPERKLDPSAVESALRTLTGISVERVVQQSEPHGSSFTLELDTEDGQYTYTLWLDGDEARIRRGDIGFTFGIPRTLYDGLRELKIEYLEAEEAEEVEG